MKITEVFQSIQGEGPWIGKRCVFLRLHGCNIHCPWCDTKYTWAGMFFELTPEKVAEMIERAELSRVVITGGEPMMQREEVVELAAQLHQYGGISVAVETNGTIDFPEATFDLAVVSPKAIQMAEHWINRDVVMKIVVNEQNVDEWMKWVKESNMPTDQLYFMPMGIHPQEIIQRSQMILQKMTQYGIDAAVSPRYHYFVGVR